MVYVPTDLHRTVKRLALDDRKSASYIYVMAIAEYLATRGIQVASSTHPPAVRPAPKRAVIDDLVDALDRQERRTDEILRRMDEARADRLPEAPPTKPAGAKVAEAMRVLLATLKSAGPDGIESRELASTLRAAGIRSGTEEAAKAVLHAAGLVRNAKRRWHLADG
ncbi:hypothetical protein [Methylorubrum extorquens]|uniref:Uncharacterized protein n=1 Tax=Methylorubrum extorquens (strain CM4 / NCIMB 13688) TaxID=440085 RepID=B7L2X0_METC4|nr:hypothetical protein [Methylorubrum extorquens]ACK86178.1 hypothetical protein Mchl_5421 [Methylorubrum extorquens CM4]